MKLMYFFTPNTNVRERDRLHEGGANGNYGRQGKYVVGLLLGFSNPKLAKYEKCLMEMHLGKLLWHKNC